MTPPPAEFTADAATGSPRMRPSLAESYRTVALPGAGVGFWRKLAAFAGPGYLVAVGYMDPGNWATAIAGGSAFGYTLVSVILLSSLMAMVLQALAARLGIVAGMDLAQACRAHYSRPVRYMLWLLCELAIIATDLAEVIGTAIALQLLFGIPLVIGVCITSLDVLLILLLQRYGFRKLEAFIVSLLAVIAICFGIELFLSQPSLAGIADGLVPTTELMSNPAMLFIAIGIIGATVMPHNLYLHSSIVQTRAIVQSADGKKEAVRYATLDSTIALFLALFVNGSILVLAASTFHVAGRTDVAEIQDAYYLLAPLLGVGFASTVFAIALLASGQNSTITATLAGQIVMEGFLDIRLPAWLRRMITRLLAIVPAAAVAIIFGESGTAHLLVLSQVILSLQLPFAIIPLVRFTSDRKLMGDFANPTWLKILACAISLLIVALNLKLLYDFFLG